MKPRACPHLSTGLHAVQVYVQVGDTACMPTHDRMYREALVRGQGACALCGHEGGVMQADHIKPQSRYPDLRTERTNYQRVHGVQGCPVCGEKCNQVKGNGESSRPVRSQDW